MPWEAAATETAERPQYDEDLKATAARFLYADLDPTPRIQGLETVAQVRAWQQVEADRDDPRTRVMAALNQRLRALRDGEADSEGDSTEVSA